MKQTWRPMWSPDYLPLEFPYLMKGEEIRTEPIDAEWCELWDSRTEPQRMIWIAARWRLFQKELVALGWSPGRPKTASVKKPRRKKPGRK